MSNGKIDQRSSSSPRKSTSIEKSGRKLSDRAMEKEGDVGNALRSIYQKTIDEAIPSEMLDLLGKLG